jgi:TonB-dependent receptor
VALPVIGKVSGKNWGNIMKKFTSLLLMFCSTLAFAADQQSQLRLYMFEGNVPVTNYFVWMDKGTKYTANEDGAALFNLAAGKHQFSVSRTGYENVNLNLDVAEGEYLQVIVTQQKGNPVSHIAIETSKEDKQGPQFNDEKKQVGEPGTINGRLLSSEDNKPVANARIYFTGVAQEFVSDKDGYFTATVGASDYSISIIHPRFATQTVDGITVVAKQTTEKQFDLSPAGIALKEFVVVAPFIQGSVASLTDERKESNSVADFVGTEQMARAGDSDAASALTRVSGLTLIDGKYVVMRGMEDRYSTVLMNGSVVPSTDPSKTAVPLDLFPASILDSIEVQKTYSADLPGAFGGGAVKLRTKKLPEEDNFSVKLSLGGNTEVTGKNVIDHKGGSTDFLGVDDGGRDIPAGVPKDFYVGGDYSPEELERFGESFSDNYQVTSSSANPDFGASVDYARLFTSGSYKYGYMTYASYKNKWDYQKSEKNTYGAETTGVLSKINDFDVDKTKNSVDIDLMFSSGIENDKNSVRYSGFFTRKSYRLTELLSGIDGENTIDKQQYKLEWSERQLFTNQFNGEHTIKDWLKNEWRLSYSMASLDTPDRRTYSYNDVNGVNNEDLGYVKYGINDVSTYREFLSMEDTTLDFGTSFNFDIVKKENITTKLKVGVDVLETDRDSQLTRYQFTWYKRNNIPDDIRIDPNPDNIYTNDNIGPNGFRVLNVTTPADGYKATQSMFGTYFIFDVDLYDRLNIVYGLRNESYEQTVDTFNFLSATDPEPIHIAQNTNDTLPSLLATLKIFDNFQVRLAMAKTVNRPTFLELSSSSYLDPETGDMLRGEPTLVSAEIEHTDLRFELYGDGSDSISLAFFKKDFKNPIEKTIIPASSADEVLSFKNSQAAYNNGIEFDFRKDLPVFVKSLDLSVSGNYAKINSEVKLSENTTEYSKKRAMQGQSPYTVNFMLMADYEAFHIKSALIYNEIGERIVKVGAGDVPHVYEEPFKSLDMTLSKELSDETNIGLKIKNILNEESIYTQGGEIYQRSKEGVSYSFDVSMKF